MDGLTVLLLRLLLFLLAVISCYLQQHQSFSHPTITFRLFHFSAFTPLPQHSRLFCREATMAKSTDKSVVFTKQDSQLGYALIEASAPYPCDVMATQVPLQYKFAQGWARATSVHPGCAHSHILSLASSRLSAVKMNYSHLLGVFPNLMLILTGSSGDGKSVPLWLDTMVMHVYRKQEYKLAMAQYQRAIQKYNDWVEAGKNIPPVMEPKEPVHIDEVYDAGSTLGLGQMMKSTEGRAVWLKHEARKLIKKLMEGNTIGSFDELNQIAEHAYYRNSPANNNSKFCIENPHLVSIWLMHIEELVGLMVGGTGKEDDDSVSGLMRFLIAHFPAVVNKLLPEGSPAEISKLIETEDYFNMLTFDELASATVNVLILLVRLFPLNKQRADEGGAEFSKLLGQHTLPWQSGAWKNYVGDFNQCTDKVKVAQSNVKTRVDASKLSKDKTRLLQFVPTVHLLEQVIAKLLPAEMTAEQVNALTPEELVAHLAKANIEDILKDFVPESVDSNVTSCAVEAGKALAAFFAKQYKLHEDIVSEIESFRLARRQLMIIQTPRPPIIFKLAQDLSVTLPGGLVERYRQLSTKGFHWADYVMDPGASKTEIQQAKYEVSALAIAGLVSVANASKPFIMSFPDEDVTVVARLTVLQLLDPTVDLQEFETTLPRDNVDSPRWSAVAAEALANLLERFSREEVTAVEVEACVDPFDAPSPGSQVDALAARAQVSAHFRGADAPNDPPAKKRKMNVMDVELSASSIEDHIEQVFHVVNSALISHRTDCPRNEFARRFASSVGEDHVQFASIIVSFKLLVAMGLAKMGARGGSATLVRPEQPEDVAKEAKRLSQIFCLGEAKVLEIMNSRGANVAYDAVEADRWFLILSPLIQARAQRQQQFGGGLALVADGAVAVALGGNQDLVHDPLVVAEMEALPGVVPVGALPPAGNGDVVAEANVGVLQAVPPHA